MPVITEARITPAAPYSLARSAATGGCPTRRLSGGVLTLTLDADGGPAVAAVAQGPDGALGVRLDAPDPGAAMDLLRRCLALDVDLGPFHAMVRDDPVMGPAARRMRGARPLPLMAPAHALLRGVTGQLVRQADALRVEFAAVRAAGRAHGGLFLPMRTEEVRRVTVPLLQSAGMARRRAESLVRALRAVNPDGLASLPTERVVARLCAQPGIGPWTAGVVCVMGLGRLDHGLVGDLGLVRIMALAEGRVVAPEETAALLDRYAPYQALAAMYLVGAHPAARISAPPAALAREAARASRPVR